jgi:hypothetical protein
MKRGEALLPFFVAFEKGIKKTNAWHTKKKRKKC